MLGSDPGRWGVTLEQFTRPDPKPRSQYFFDAMLAKIDLNFVTVAKHRVVSALAREGQKLGELQILMLGFSCAAVTHQSFHVGLWLHV